jgi:molecular chaperone GrpE
VVIVPPTVQDDASGGDAGPEPNDDASAEAAPENRAAEPIADPLDVAKQEVARLKDQLLRTAADFDNFRKRARKEQSDAEKKGREDILRELLPVFDNLERATAHAEKATDVQSVADGVGMVIRQFTDTLGKLGIERIATVGQPFDPAIHEAIQQVETAEHPPGTVAVEIQGGYRAKDRLIRPAMVVVAKAPSGSSS